MGHHHSDHAGHVVAVREHFVERVEGLLRGVHGEAVEQMMRIDRRDVAALDDTLKGGEGGVLDRLSGEGAFGLAA